MWPSALDVILGTQMSLVHFQSGLTPGLQARPLLEDVRGANRYSCPFSPYPSVSLEINKLSFKEMKIFHWNLIKKQKSKQNITRHIEIKNNLSVTRGEVREANGGI